ncbi:MAG: methyltransferase domain-containing protein, partial [Lachnospiraceae bacterium]|nr:methyltransferase domain-containing protein [Lachnospiraceae bacterium]
MKKGQEYTGTVREIKFPDKGVVYVDTDSGEEKCIVKNTLPGQTVRFVVNKKKNGNCEGILKEVVSHAPGETEPECPHFGVCGGCAFLNLPYEEQLKLKENQVREIMRGCHESFGDDGALFDKVWEGIKPSPVQYGYRNKMEFSFGDSCRNGELELGLHKRWSFYDVISVKHCKIADEDYRSILAETLAYFRGKETPYFHKRSHEGYLRHLLIRKALKTGEILVDIITTSQTPRDTPCTEVSLLEDWKEALLCLKLRGRIRGILHTVNDSVADAVKNEHTEILYGESSFEEELSGLRFSISPFSFFQTNSYSAEVIYDTAREYVMSTMNDPQPVMGEKEEADQAFKAVSSSNEAGQWLPVIFDLYSGTGTIAQLMSPVAKKVIGVEIVEEAVAAAVANAQKNGITNCEFIAGDVLKMLDTIEEKPDLIILDPPRDGIHPKAIYSIIDYGVRYILYISCKPTSLARDLEIFAAHGYYPQRM